MLKTLDFNVIVDLKPRATGVNYSCPNCVEWGDMIGQRERAAQLFALALKARENSDDSLADNLVALAMEILDEADQQPGGTENSREGIAKQSK